MPAELNDDPVAAPGAKGRAAEQAYLAIRDGIFAGRLAEADRLTEVELSEWLGMSRTPVREAVKRLLLEGLLTREAGPGLRVVGMQADEVEQVFQIRLMLESYAARRAAEHATPEQKQRLHALAARMAARVPPRTEQDYQVISEANEEFHRTVLEAAQSSRLVAMLSVVVHLALVMRTFRMYGEADIRRSSAHHIEIADAIAAGAPDWAAAAMSAHLLAAASIARTEPRA